MSDGRKNNGAKKGVHQGQGRKPKADELKLIEELSIYDDIAKKCLENGIKDGNYQFWNKFMEYRYGKPKERMDVTSNDETLNLPIINFVKTKS